MIRRVAVILLACVIPIGYTRDREVACLDHPHTLQVREIGREHVVHRVVLDRAVRVVEIENEMWFVESVACTARGFTIEASHVQYNDPVKRRFQVLVVGKRRYELK
jgi:hypothetical protein